jgi:hypothetical protein
MAKRSRKPDKGPGQGWIVTFSDCMTLLLCFFVLLLTFSTFEEQEKLKIIGLFETIRMHSVFRNRHSDAAAMPPTEEIMETPEGTPKKPDSNLPPVDQPYRPVPSEEQDHLKSYRTIFVPVSRLFKKGSTEILPQAKEQYLDVMYDYLHYVDCDVIFNECRMDAPTRMQPPSLKRCRALIDYFSQERELKRERFSLGGTDMGDRSRLGSLEPLIAITFLQSGLFGGPP